MERQEFFTRTSPAESIELMKELILVLGLSGGTFDRGRIVIFSSRAIQVPKELEDQIIPLAR